MLRPIAPFALQPADVLTLQSWPRMSTLEQSRAQRARILLLRNEAVPPIAICGQLQITTPTVFKWRKRYLN
ncbi:TPA: helix-turn-helix domain-containing protein [Pseudomonas putida]|nr:helix-turn-helix domain-containing protein [Pseudomonas putida]